jgi:hypothetical protein
VRLQGTQMNLERNAVQAIHDAVEQQSGKIDQQVEQALARTLRDIQQGAAQVNQNVKESNWLFVGGMFVAGIVIGLFAGYYFVIRPEQDGRPYRPDRAVPVCASPAGPRSARFACPSSQGQGEIRHPESMGLSKTHSQSATSISLLRKRRYLL